MKPLSITVWNEGRHERDDPAVRAIYPRGMHGEIVARLTAEPGFQARAALLDEPDQGLPADILDATDVLVWWGHRAHAEVRDDLVDRILRRIEAGMGLVSLHSTHFAKVFTRLHGTSCRLKWRVAGEIERVWTVNPSHPIARGVPISFELKEEMYGEPFDVPDPDEVVFISWFEGGEVFRSGCTWTHGRGRVFYFRPGHELYPTYHNPHVLRVIANAARWAGGEG